MAPPRTQPVPPLSKIPHLPESTIAKMKDLLHKFTSPSSNPDPENPLDPLPGMMYSIVDREGRELFCHGEGARDILYPEVPIDDKTVMFLGSLTKLVTAIGCLIAVEEGRIALDDWEALYKIVPEIPAKQILMGFDEDYEPIWKDVPEHCPKITMRLLLTHISGFGTTFFSEDLWDFHERDIWQDDIFGGWEWMEQSPLINEPGAVWQYGVGLDYAGKAIERIYGMKFGDFCDKYIFGPLDIHDTMFEPNPSMCDRMMSMHHRIEDGVIIRSPAINFARVSPAKGGKGHHSPGSGLFTTAHDWNVVLSTVLNQGYCHATGKRIIKAETLEELFTPQLGPENLPLPPLITARPEFCMDLPDLDPGDPTKNFGLGLIIVGEKDGVYLPDGSRGKACGTGWWVGATSVMYFIDRASGIAGFLASTLMPFPDPKLMELCFSLESEVYRGLRESEGNTKLEVSSEIAVPKQSDELEVKSEIAVLESEELEVKSEIAVPTANEELQVKSEIAVPKENEELEASSGNGAPKEVDELEANSGNDVPEEIDEPEANSGSGVPKELDELEANSSGNGISKEVTVLQETCMPRAIGVPKELGIPQTNGHVH